MGDKTEHDEIARIKSIINDPFNADDFSECEYYHYGDMPIRVVYGYETDVPISAHVFDPDTQTLKIRTDLITEALNHPHSDKITEEEFYKLCNQLGNGNPKPSMDL